MIYLRQSTASQEIPLGYFVDSTDGNTEETALSIANTDIKVWKTGATTLANKNSGGATHISNGIYYATMDATDTDTIGSLVVFVHVSGALTVRVPCCVLDEAVYDVMFGTVAPATATNITAGTITTVTNLTNAPTSGDLTSTMKTSVENAVWDAARASHATAGTFGQGAASVQGNVTGSVASVTGAVGSVTGAIGSLGATAKSDVNAEVVDALATDTYAEPAQGAPGATVSLATKIGFLYKAWRNKTTQTSTQYSLLNDDAATVDHKATFTDDGVTATRGEVASGP